MPTPLTACIITFNEEERLATCLSSLNLCDEILVVDSHSTDATREIAASLGARVIERDWPGYAAQKEYAIRAAANDWVLCIDADEFLSPGLQAEIAGLRDAGFAGASGFEMPRCTRYLGAWIRHGTWYPDRQLRLFDRRRGGWVSPHVHGLHERVELDGTARTLVNDLLHEPYRSISAHLKTIDRYTTAMADGMHAAGRRARVDQLVLTPAAEFVRFYLLKSGFMDGWRGLVLAYLHAHYVRMKYAKLMAPGRPISRSSSRARKGTPAVVRRRRARSLPLSRAKPAA
jgi:glycosyltransferase involved in cell wall biosynthesis